MATYVLTIYWHYPESRKSGGDYLFEASSDADALTHVRTNFDEQVGIADQAALTGSDGRVIWESDWPIAEGRSRLPSN